MQPNTETVAFSKYCLKTPLVDYKLNTPSPFGGLQSNTFDHMVDKNNIRS